MSDLLVTVVFTESGPLGLNLGSTDSGPTVLKSLTPGSLGAAQPKLDPGFYPGLSCAYYGHKQSACLCDVEDSTAAFHRFT